MYARTDDRGAFRDGLTETQFNKELQKNGFVRVRDRRNFVTNRSEDPTGAGMYRFSHLKWRNPEDGEERAELVAKFHDLAAKFPLITLGLKLEDFIDVVASFRAAWEGGKATASGLELESEAASAAGPSAEAGPSSSRTLAAGGGVDPGGTDLGGASQHVTSQPTLSAHLGEIRTFQTNMNFDHGPAGQSLQLASPPKPPAHSPSLPPASTPLSHPALSSGPGSASSMAASHHILPGPAFKLETGLPHSLSLFEAIKCLANASSPALALPSSGHGGGNLNPASFNPVLGLPVAPTGSLHARDQSSAAAGGNQSVRDQASATGSWGPGAGGQGWYQASASAQGSSGTNYAQAHSHPPASHHPGPPPHLQVATSQPLPAHITASGGHGPAWHTQPMGTAFQVHPHAGYTPLPSSLPQAARPNLNLVAMALGPGPGPGLNLNVHDAGPHAGTAASGCHQSQTSDAAAGPQRAAGGWPFLDATANNLNARLLSMLGPGGHGETTASGRGGGPHPVAPGGSQFQVAPPGTTLKELSCRGTGTGSEPGPM